MSYQAEVIEIQYYDAARNSDKFYRSYRLWDDDSGDNRVVFQWGRRGAKGQSQVHVATSPSHAARMVSDKLQSKLNEGYMESYRRELPGVSNDILEMAGINRFATREEMPSADPFVRLSVDVDTCRRLAMGDNDDITKAVTLRAGLLEQLAALRTSVAKAEGEVEVVDMVLGAKMAC